MPDTNFETLSGSSTGEKPDNPWVEAEMDVNAEITDSEPKLIDRIKEMTIENIKQLDFRKLSDDEYSALKERVEQLRPTINANYYAAIGTETTNIAESTVKTELSPEDRELKNKLVNNAALKSAIDNAIKDIKELAKNPRRVIAALGVTAMLATTGVGAYMATNGLRSDAKTTGTQDEQYEDDETEIGIKDGYDKEGLYLSENKTGPYNFSCGDEVEKVCDGDHHKELEYVAENQVESLADYIANMPDEVKPDGFEGLTILETEQKLESLSDEDYEKVMKQFKDSVEESTVKETTIDGECDNAYIYKEDGTEAVHENMELVNSTTTEENTPIIEYSWVDENGNVLDSLKVKKVCRQAVNRKGLRKKVYSGMKVISLKHPGDPQKGDTPDTPPQPKNQEEANENSGANEGIVTPEKQERKVTPEPSANEDHPYNQNNNTYNYTPKEQVKEIGSEVKKDTGGGGTVSSGEKSGGDKSADGSGNTIKENLDNAAGEGNYDEGF